MRRTWALSIVVVLPLLVLGLILGAWGGVPAQAAPPHRPLRQAPGDCVVTSTADSGPGSLRACMLGLEPGATITFSTSVFPPASPATISLSSALPTIITDNVTIDASDVGVILDGGGIGTNPETVLLDEVSLTLDGGPNLLSNGDFSAGLGHWRPLDTGPGATRALNTADYVSSPNSYAWSAVAHTGESYTVYDAADSSDPFYDWPYDNGSTVWIPASDGSTVELRFWCNYGSAGATLMLLYADGHNELWQEGGCGWGSGWTQDIISQTLPADAIGVAIQLSYSHSQARTNGLMLDGADQVIIKGLQILNFPNNGIELYNGASFNIIGGTNSSPGGACAGDCNLISGNGRGGVSLWGSDVLSNTISGNYIGTDASGTAVMGNTDHGITVGEGVQYTRIGGNTPGQRNLISGNRLGVLINGTGASNNTVSGNFIGANASGTAIIGNRSEGVEVSGGAQYNLIGGDNASPGGDCTGACNLIGGNNGYGVAIRDYDTANNTVSGNYIGTDLDGTAALGNTADGVRILDGAAFNLVGGDTPAQRNLISGNEESGVRLRGSGTMHNVVSSNYVGTDVNGISALPNDEYGVYVGHGASYNLVGGNNASHGADCTGACNLISGNRQYDGVSLSYNGTVSNTVSGNYIGTDASGTFAVGQGRSGIEIFLGASYNLVGGDTPAQRNLISGNGHHGIRIQGSGAMGNIISGNYIGTDVSGTAAVSNASDGVFVGLGAHDNLVGGDTPQAGNLISGNNLRGVQIYGNTQYGQALSNTVRGNIIGTDYNGTVGLPNGDSGVGIGGDAAYNMVGPDNLIALNGVNGVWVTSHEGRAPINNRITRNAIHSNARKGIELDGGNLELFPPILTDVGVNYVRGQAPPGSRVEIFSDAEDEGRYYHGSTAADASGDFTFSQPGAFTGANVTATATDADGNTSEFSAAYTPLVDVQVVAILRPKSSGEQNQMVTPQIKIGNAGTTAETGISVSVSATGDALSAAYSDSQAGLSLPPLGYATLSFQPFTPTTVGSYDLTASIALVGDQDPANNTKSQAVQVSNTTIDLWTRDHPADVGDIPAYPFWLSPDLWVRRSCDGGTQHQDPVAGQENCVYMFVRNRGDAASDGADTARVYWHEPSLGIKCSKWAPIGTQIIASTPAYTGVHTLAFTWIPTRTGHTCLYGEIVSDDDPAVVACDIAWDNNLSQRNVSIIPGGEGLSAQASGAIVFEVTNIKEAPKPVALILDISDVPDPNAVRLDLGDDLAARWASVDGLAQSSGITWDGGSVVTVTHPSSATLAGIPMAGGETQTVTLLVDAPSVETTTVSIYEAIDAGPGVPLIDAVVGGNTYIFSTETSAVYLPIVLKD